MSDKLVYSTGIGRIDTTEPTEPTFSGDGIIRIVVRPKVEKVKACQLLMG